jgi:hypothetical protein
VVVPNTRSLRFAGATVADLGNGEALITIGGAPTSNTVITTDYVYTTLFTLVVPDLHVGQLTATVNARKDDGTERAGFIRVGQFWREGGTAQLSSKVHTLFTDKSYAGYNVRLQPSGNDILVQVRGEIAHTVKWIGSLTYQVVGQP